MYVCIVARGVPSTRYRMNGLFEYDQAKALVNNGVKIVYVALDLRSIRRWRRWGIYRSEENGVIIYRVNVPVGAVPDKILCMIGKCALFSAFRKIVKKEGKPDIIHSHFIQQAYMSSALAEKYNIAHVITEHSEQVNREELEEDIFEFAQKAYKSAQEVIVVSQALKKRLDDKFDINCSVVSNIIDFSCFKVQEKECGDSFRFISVGGLVPGKRMDLLVRAFCNTFEEDANVSLVIFGEGEERNKVEQIIDENNMRERIILKGLQTRDVIYAEMKECHCFILLSESETFGVAYAEAMAAGLPVIATKCGGPEEFVNECNGMMVPVNDMQSIENAMKVMRNNIKQYDSHNIGKYITNKYSNESIVRELLLIYNRVLGEKH